MIQFGKLESFVLPNPQIRNEVVVQLHLAVTNLPVGPFRLPSPIPSNSLSRTVLTNLIDTQIRPNTPLLFRDMLHSDTASGIVSIA